MNKMLSLTAVLMLSASTALADDFKLYYIAEDGNVASQTWEVASLKKITFENGQMNVITTDDQVSSLPTSGIQSLVFYTEEGITGIEDTKDKSAAPATKSEVYDLMGRRIDTDREELPKGLYIIDGKKTLIK